jgi:hypothetical protein
MQTQVTINESKGKHIQKKLKMKTKTNLIPI